MILYRFFFSLHPSPYPSSFFRHPLSFILRYFTLCPSSFVISPTSFVLHSLSFILRNSILRHFTCILHSSPFFLRPSSFALLPSPLSSIFLHPSFFTSIIYPSPFHPSYFILYLDYVSPIFHPSTWQSILCPSSLILRPFLQVAMIGFPPLEDREDSLRALGRVDLFGTGVNPQQMERMRQLEVSFPFLFLFFSCPSNWGFTRKS